MDSNITVALISLVGIIITALVTKSSFSHELDKKIAIIEEHLKIVDKKLDIHNGYAEKFGDIQVDIAIIKSELKNINEDKN